MSRPLRRWGIVLGLAVVGGALAPAPSPGPPGPPPRLKELAEGRAKLARRLFEAAEKMVVAPPAVDPAANAARPARDVSELARWSRGWMEADRDLAADEAGRTRALQAHLDRLKKWRQPFRELAARSIAGVTQKEVDMLEFFVLEAESELVKAEGRR